LNEDAASTTPDSPSTGARSPRALARRRMARIAVVYALLTAGMVIVNVATHGPSWWYFAAAGFGFAIAMQWMRVRR